MYAGVAAMGAEDAWHLTCLEMEEPNEPEQFIKCDGSESYAECDLDPQANVSEPREAKQEADY